MKVFLSHSTKDKAFVVRLAAALENAKFEPWLCEVDVEKNANFVAEIEKGLAQCDVSLVVWSPDSAKSDWTREEWTSILARQVAEQRIRLGIVLLRDYPLPELLRSRNYIDARSDEGAALTATVKWLQRREGAQRLSGLQAPVYLPDYRPRDFVGREAYLGRLQEMLIAQPGTFLLYGEPGAGKSMLALRFSWDMQKDFDAVIYQSCGEREIDEITAELADKLPLDVKTQLPEEKRKRAIQWLRGRQSLLVLDDVWNFDVKQLEPGPPCSVLYTSRKKSLPWISAEQSLEVERFRDEEAEQLFHAYLATVFGEDELVRCREGLLAFARKVEMLPIALAAAGSLLRGKSASRLERSILKLRLDELNDGIRDVPQLFQKAIAMQPHREQRLLTASAVCLQEGFWLPLAARIAKLGEDEADDLADNLVNSSLLRVLNREKRRFQLHNLLREQVRADCSAQALQNLQQGHADALLTLSADWKRHSPWQFTQEIWLASSFLEGVDNLQQALALEKKEEAMLLELGMNVQLQRNYATQADLLYRMQQLEKALALLKKQELICLQLNDKNSLQLGYFQAASCMLVLERFDEALTLIRKQEALCLELGNREFLSSGYRIQAYVLYLSERWPETLAVLEKEEEICQELGTKGQLGLCYFMWGNLAGIQGDRTTEQQKLRQALALFDELDMSSERDATQSALDNAESV